MKRAWNDENALRLMCSDCFSGKKLKPSKYINKMLTMRELKLAGYPLSPNTLTIDEWIDLKNIENELYEIFNPKRK